MGREPCWLHYVGALDCIHRDSFVLQFLDAVSVDAVVVRLLEALRERQVTLTVAYHEADSALLATDGRHPQEHAVLMQYTQAMEELEEYAVAHAVRVPYQVLPALRARPLRPFCGVYLPSGACLRVTQRRARAPGASVASGDQFPPFCCDQTLS